MVLLFPPGDGLGLLCLDGLEVGLRHQVRLLRVDELAHQASTHDKLAHHSTHSKARWMLGSLDSLGSLRMHGIAHLEVEEPVQACQVVVPAHTTHMPVRQVRESRPQLTALIAQAPRERSAGTRVLPHTKKTPSLDALSVRWLTCCKAWPQRWPGSSPRHPVSATTTSTRRSPASAHTHTTVTCQNTSWTLFVPGPA